MFRVQVKSQIFWHDSYPVHPLGISFFSQNCFGQFGKANEALMKVVWALLGRRLDAVEWLAFSIPSRLPVWKLLRGGCQGYLAAGNWAYQLQLAELQAVHGAASAIAPWSIMKRSVSPAITGCFCQWSIKVTSFTCDILWLPNKWFLLIASEDLCLPIFWGTLNKHNKTRLSFCAENSAKDGTKLHPQWA